MSGTYFNVGANFIAIKETKEVPEKTEYIKKTPKNGKIKTFKIMKNKK